MSTDLLGSLLRALDAELPRAVALRERLHASPELSHQERDTAAAVADFLGSENVSPVAGTGLIARV